MQEVRRSAPSLIGGTASMARSAAAQATRIRVALLDEREHSLVRTAGWLAVHAPDLDVVLTATSWRGLVQSPAFPTDLVVLDVQPREPVSIEARVRTCRASGAKVILRTALDTPDLRARALAAGVETVLAIRDPLDRLAAAARAALSAGEEERDWRPRPAEPVRRPRLSLGEEQALKLYASGSSTPQVAQAMNVRFETAKTYLRRVRDKYAKVDRPASRREDLVRRAVEDGYLS